MSKENLNNQLVLDAVNELQNSDFSHLKESIQLLVTCAMEHDYLNNPNTRAELYAAFKSMYNFLLKMEMNTDPEIEYVNLLTD